MASGVQNASVALISENLVRQLHGFEASIAQNSSFRRFPKRDVDRGRRFDASKAPDGDTYRGFVSSGPGARPEALPQRPLSRTRLLGRPKCERGAHFTFSRATVTRFRVLNRPKLEF